LRDFVVDVSVHGENGRVTLVVETEDTGNDPLQVPEGDDGIAIAIVRGIPETIEHRRENGKSRFEIAVRTDEIARSPSRLRTEN
jgi:hypothetical protein